MFIAEHEDNEWDWDGNNEEAKQNTSHDNKSTEIKNITPIKGQGLDLSTGKNNKQESVLNAVNDRKSNNDNTSKNRMKKDLLGGEYDIKIDKYKCTSTEPDYFADMVPSIQKYKSIDAKTINTYVTSKFDAVDLNLQVILRYVIIFVNLV